MLALIFILSAGFIKTETFLRATPLLPQFRRYPGFQREIVQATLENCNISWVFLYLYHKRFLLTVSLRYGKPYF